MDAESKSILLSKTCIANVVLASILELHPTWSNWAQNHPQTIILGYTVMNIALRYVSEGPVHWIKAKAKPLC